MSPEHLHPGQRMGAVEEAKFELHGSNNPWFQIDAPIIEIFHFDHFALMGLFHGQQMVCGIWILRVE